MKSQRLRSAALGFTMTLSLLAVVACLQLAFAPGIVAATWSGNDPNVDTYAVPAFRRSLLEFHLEVASILAGYWLFAAAFGRGDLRGIRSADVSLILSGLSFALTMLISSAVPQPSTLLKGACPLFGITDTYPSFGFDNVTPCEDFVKGVSMYLLIGLPTILMLVSALLQVLVSRRRARR